MNIYTLVQSIKDPPGKLYLTEDNIKKSICLCRDMIITKYTIRFCYDIEAHRDSPNITLHKPTFKSVTLQITKFKTVTFMPRHKQGIYAQARSKQKHYYRFCKVVLVGLPSTRMH